MSTPSPIPIRLSQSTRFPPSAAGTRSPPQSPSRSPLRKAQFTAQEVNPLVDNLSPISTVKALSVTEALSTSRPRDADILGRSIAEASLAERAYGVRAAVAAQKLREWHAELHGWKWPAPKHRRLGKGFQPRATASPRPGTSSSNAKGKEYTGSLPTTVVAQHEERVEAIKDGLEALNVEELKKHVLSAHARSSSHHATLDATPGDLVQLTDFTAVITQTMLQALPYLAKLTALLDDWDTRIMVLKQVPHLSRQLGRMEMAMESVAQDVRSQPTSGILTRTHFEETKAVLGSDVSRLGATFDKTLDLLEGREDSLPDSWIHRMDKLEVTFAQWAVEAERIVLNNEWTEQKWACTPRRNKNSQSSNTLNYTIVENEDLSSTNPQAQSSTGSLAKVERGASAWPESEQSRSRDWVRTDLMSKGNVDSTSSVDAVEARPSKSGAVSASPFPDDAKDGLPLLVEPQSSRTTKHGVALPLMPQRTQHDPSHVTSQELRTSLIANKPATPGQSPNPGASRKENLETANQPRMLAMSLDDSSHINSHARDQPGAAPTDGVVTSAKVSQRDSPSVDENPVHAPIENRSKFLHPNVSVQSVHQRSDAIRGPPMSNTSMPNSMRTNHHRHTSDVSAAESALSEPFSDLSTAEIADATTAAAPGSPRIVSHSVRASGDGMSNFFGRQKAPTQSMDFQRYDMPPEYLTERRHRKTASMSSDEIKSSRTLPVKTSDTVINGEDEDDDDAESLDVMADQPTPRSVPSQRTIARISSMEVPKFRSILVDRKGSSSSSTASPISPLDANESYTETDSVRSVSPLESSSSTSMSRKFLRRDYFQRAGQNEEGIPTTDSRYLRPVEDDIEAQGTTRRPSKPLSRGLSTDRVATWSKDSKALAVPAHSAHEIDDVDPYPHSWSTAPSSVPVDDNEEVRTPCRRKDETHEDLLESKIQSLLTCIPARIRLLSDCGPESPSLTSTTPSRPHSPIPSIILSPVRSKRCLQTSRSSIGHSDVRLFHLSRTIESHGTPPTKLFVRLDGEHGERVMVRVGPGWADLGDYLRDYSLHHSKRGLNDGQFELANFPAGGQTDRKDSRVIAVGPELTSKARVAGSVPSHSTPPTYPRPTDHLPPAMTPVGALRAMRHRRSASAMAMHQSGGHDSGQSSSAYSFPSDADNINMESGTPPVPSIPQIRSLNPYFGDDPRSSGPPRRPNAAVSSQWSPALTPSHDPLLQPLTPASTSSSQRRRRHNATPDSAGTGPAESSSTKQSNAFETKSLSTNSAAGSIALHPADTHARTHLHSSPTVGGSITANPMPGASPLGGAGGIRRVFFRKKAG